MDSLSVNDNAGRQRGPVRALRQRHLLDLFISDAVNDVEVIARELGLRGAMRGRLRRALDRMACAQSVLETVCEEASEAEQGGAAAELKVREAVGLLAREWPEEYPAGAVEWVLLER